MINRLVPALWAVAISVALSLGCKTEQPANTASLLTDTSSFYMNKPLVTDLYTADPSAHVFKKRIYIYPSHDIDACVAEKDDGSHFDMRNYHVYSMPGINGPVTDHGVVLKLKDIPWASRQLRVPDVAYKKKWPILPILSGQRQGGYI